MTPTTATEERGLGEALRILSRHAPIVTPLTIENARSAVELALQRTVGNDRDVLEVVHATETLSFFFGVPL